MTARLSARGLVVRRGQRRVLDGVDLETPAGKVLALVGPNGAGKSTLLDALAGLLPVEAGTVHLDGVPVGAMPRAALARRLACLGQAEQPDGELTGLEVALLGRSPHLGPWGLPARDDVAGARAALARTDAAALAGRRLATLSGGERQRVMLARALCQGGDAVLMDEPTHSLDPGHAFHVMEQLRAEAGRGAAVVVALHDLALAAAFSDTVAVLRGGAVIARGPWREALTAGVLTQTFGLPMEMAEVRGRPVVVMGAAPP